MYLSIKPTILKQAEAIATSRSTTFKNWQAVIRAAIIIGLPKVKEGIFVGGKSMDAPKIDTPGYGGGGMKLPVCPMRDDMPSTCEHGCIPCRDAGRPLYNNHGVLLDRGLSKE